MSLAAAQLPKVGDALLQRWNVEAEIGRGGMGVVLRVRDTSGRVAAMKVLSPEAATEVPETIPRFLNEAKAASQLKSENVVRVYDTGTLENGLPFIVMELLEGADLGTVLERRGPLPITDVCDAVIHASDALAEAHAQGMVHRDLKPGNLFRTRGPNGQPIVKVLDFGVAKIASASKGGAQTAAGAFLGSPHYMAPEQMKSAKDADARADVWSLGVVMYELLMGKLPFEGRSFGQLFLQITLEEPAPIDRADCPPGLIEIVNRCMSKNRDDRYSDLAALVHSLARFASPDGASRARALAAKSGAPAQPLSSSRMAAFAGTVMMSGTPSSTPRMPVAAPQAAPPPPASSPNIGFAAPSSGALPQIAPSRQSQPDLPPYQPPPQRPVVAQAPVRVKSNIVIIVGAVSAVFLILGIVMIVLVLRAR